LFGEKCTHSFDNVTCINDGKRLGQVARLNMGLELLDTDYFSFMGVDDYLIKIPECDADFYYGDHIQQRRMYRIDTDHGLYNTSYVKSKPFDIQTYKQGNYIAGGAAFVKTEIAKKIGFNEIFGLGGDWIFFNKVAQIVKPTYIDTAIYVERIGTSHIRIPGTRAIRRFIVKYNIK
jgi:hypothetical protein